MIEVLLMKPLLYFRGDDEVFDTTNILPTQSASHVKSITESVTDWILILACCFLASVFMHLLQFTWKPQCYCT